MACAIPRPKPSSRAALVKVTIWSNCAGRPATRLLACSRMLPIQAGQIAAPNKAVQSSVSATAAATAPATARHWPWNTR